MAPEGAIVARDAGAAIDSPNTTESASQLNASPEAMVEDEPASEPTSATPSRSTTMSPRPETASTVGTTPAPTTADDGGSKSMEVDEESFAASSRVHLRTMDSSAAQSHERQATSSTSPHDTIGALDWDDSGLAEGDLMSPSMGSDFPSLRMIPSSPSSFLRAGSKFHGTQQSERQVYDVQVEIKHVDLKESFLCGYLRIQGLTEDHPTLTTYFEGEIIGTKYNFITDHDTWGATNRIDLNHWKKFTAFRPLEKQARKGPVYIRDVAQRENIFMRWKEHFLVPDHRVRTITGASFEGFYYICFNQLKGEVSGIYFHAKSEKFQQLELKHVEDRGCFSSVEFR